MARSLFLDLTCGASGDMIVAALLDLGDSEAALRTALASLPMADEFEVEVGRRSVAGLDACDFDVLLASGDTRDHDMAYLHGRGEGHECAAHEHEHERCHGRDHARDHDHAAHHHHPHAHRGLAEVRAIIEAADVTPAARALALRTFDILARAEAAAHGTTPEQVHFHEVGAVDSIVDILAAAVLLDDLAPERVFATPLPDGHGTVRCQHGIIPVPVPAVVNVCRQQGIPFAHVDVEGELVTPTGAALVAAMDACFTLPGAYVITASGLGAGKRAYEVPSVVRAHLIEGAAHAAPVSDAIYKLECDIDDAPSEQLAYAAERLVAAGAREVHWVPVFTKKGRPAYQLQVIAAPEDVERMEGIIFSETTTIGIRRQRMERTVLPREESQVQTAFGPVRTKTVTLPDGTRRAKPEYEDVAAIARRTGLPLGEVLRRL